MSEAAIELFLSMSQSCQILAHLKSGRSITPIEALELYGCFRLAGRIKDLRDAKFEIETEMVNENGKTFAKYSMKSNTPDAYKIQRSLEMSA